MLGSPGKTKQKDSKPCYFSTKSVTKAVPKIESTRVRTKITIKGKNDIARVKT